jgi:hypothetical protein
MEISSGQTIQKIIFKLMEKVPEKRYQSAEGLLSDLNKYSRGQRDFVLGLDDKQVKLTYRTKLIGRKQELNTLKKLSDKALEGQGSICLVSGRAR